MGHGRITGKGWLGYGLLGGISEDTGKGWLGYWHFEGLTQNHYLSVFLFFVVAFFFYPQASTGWEEWDRWCCLLSKWGEGTPWRVWVPSAGLGAEIGPRGTCVALVGTEG